MNKIAAKEIFRKDLERELKALEETLELVKEQRQALIDYDPEKIYETARRLEIASRATREAEIRRIENVGKLLGASEEESKNVKLSDLNKAFDGEFDDLREKFAALLEEIESVNHFNRLLANRARRGISKIMEALSDESEKILSAKV